ncbi:hypothetical protein G5B47_21790 [Paenibacillus sp. 7124]|uniref:Uncharacterized protein n=1 Tax=Paenibacillus apii TaxID=1850370 RepID=A0A6M1PMW9_9BACL|nr:hypothetical protein [Paenibacillus apii]NGM85037.1 hypothetical protein [Paenibacillus apii]
MVHMGIRMPLASGLMATARTKDRLPGEQPPYIVAEAAYARRGDRERDFSLGIRDFVSTRFFSPEFDRIQLTRRGEASQ